MRHLLTHTGGTGDIFTPEFAQHRLELCEPGDYLELYGTRDVVFVDGVRTPFGKAGGKLKSGIHYRSTTRENTSAVLLTVLRAAGVPLSEFGYGFGRTTSTVSAIEA